MSAICIFDQIRRYFIFQILIIILEQKSIVPQRYQQCLSMQQRTYENNCYLKEYIFYHPNMAHITMEAQGTMNTYAYSSVWCHRNKLSLSCKFRNMCYNPKENNFLFLLHPLSIISGVDNMKQINENLFLSSINGHNAFQIKLVTVNKIDVLKNLEWIQRSILLFSKFKPDNLYHVFHDDLLPLYFTLIELSDSMDGSSEKRGCDFNEFILGLVGHSQNFKYDYLYNFLFNRILNLNNLDPRFIYCFKTSYAGTNKLSLWYNYGFKGISGPILNENFHRAHIESFKNCFLNYYGISRIQKQSYCVILSRKTSRKILNEAEVLKALQKSLAKINSSLKGKIISIENDGVLVMIKYIMSSNLLIGMHGAGMVLALFMPITSSVIEMWPYGINSTVSPIYSTLCTIIGVHYTQWLNKDFANTQIHTDFSPNHIFNQRYYSSKEMNKHLQKGIARVACCDDPEWLLRVNQDTVINIHNNVTYKSVLFEHVLLMVLTVQNASLTNNKNLLSNRVLASVTNATCKVLYQKSFFELNVFWHKPWNLHLLFCPTTRYEVVVGVLKGNAHKYVTSELYFHKRYSYLKMDSINVWITTICEGVLGHSTYMNCCI